MSARLLRVALVGIGLIVLIGYWVRTIRKPRGDFELHWDMAGRLLTGQFLYRPLPTEFHPYPPFWAMFHAPFALLPLPVAEALFYPIGAAAVIGLFVLLARMLRPYLPESSAWRALAIAAGAVLASRYLTRDLNEGGVNTLLVLLTWAGIFLWMRGRDWLGGASLGLAIALKCTPALFVVYFAFKRQWKMTAASALFTALFTLAPALWLGPQGFAETFGHWFGRVLESAQQSDPSIGINGEEPVGNMSLRPRLARWLMPLPEGHNLRPPVGNVELFAFSPPVAGAIVRGALLALLLVSIWFFRRPIRERDRPHVLWECAGVGVLMLLLSPTTWGQHCVALLPACLLIAATLFTSRAPAWVCGVTAYYVLVVLLLGRSIVGRQNNLALDSYGLETWALLGLLAICFAGANGVSKSFGARQIAVDPPIG